MTLQNVKKVIIGSKNPSKIEAVKEGFESMFPMDSFTFEGIDAASHVSDQPQNCCETLLGARNRAQNAKIGQSDADFWVGLEGGIERKADTMEVFAWIVILSKNAEGKSKTASFELPQKIIQLIDSGMELGEADDIVFTKKQSKLNSGATGLLTEDLIPRSKYYSHSVILALIPFKNEALYMVGGE